MTEETNGRLKISWRALGVTVALLVMFSGWIAREFDKVYDEIDKVEVAGDITNEMSIESREAIIWIKNRLEKIEDDPAFKTKLQTYMKASLLSKNGEKLEVKK